MKLFSVEIQSNQVQWLLPQVVATDAWPYTVFDCTAKRDTWQAIHWKLLDSTMPSANFYTLGNHGSFAFDEAVYQSELFPFLSQAGEILPIHLSNTVLYALNVITCIDKLDLSVTPYPTGLFKLSATHRAQIITCANENKSDFINAYSRTAFKGLHFREINPITLVRL